MLKLIKGGNISDIKRELSRLLNEGSMSPKVRQMALQAIADYSDDEQIRAIHLFVRDNVKYVSDPKDTELFIAPWIMCDLIERGVAAGDCDDMALFTASLLKSIGYNTKIIILDTQGGGYDHAISEAFSNKTKEWLTLDPTGNKPVGWVFSYHSKMEVV